MIRREAQMKLALLLVLFLPLSSLFADGPKLAFTYENSLEPYDTYPCTSEKADFGIYDWDVRCTVGRTVRRFTAHFALTFYAKGHALDRVRHGRNVQSAHEVLYWVTDWQDSSHPVSHSSTIWFFHKTAEDALAEIDLNQGVDSDNASLRLRFIPAVSILKNHSR
jgi:hypothetical protein